jgi:RNA polymerase sigma factor (sigma-70 family)
VDELTDETIMLKVKDGHLSELTELFERYHVKLYNFFLKLTYDQASSEDLTQNLFYRIIKYRHSYGAEAGTFKSWIYQMARNLHYDHLKEQKKNAAQFTKLEEAHEQVRGMERSSYNEEDFKKLDLALLKLQPDQREMILLSRFEGLKYEEISRMNGKSILAIKVQVHRAIKQLRHLYFTQQ